MLDVGHSSLARELANSAPGGAMTSFTRSTIPFVLSAGLLVAATGCFHDWSTYVCEPLLNAPLSEPTSTEEHEVVNDLGRMFIVEGQECGQSDRPGKEDYVHIGHRSKLPTWADQATVIFNGWRTEYIHGNDKPVAAVGGVIADVFKSSSTLSWSVAGVLRDSEFTEGYSFCYGYTVLAWSTAAIDATAMERSVDPNACLPILHLRADDNPMSVIATFSRSASFPHLLLEGRTAVVIPRGVGLGERDSKIQEIGYQLGEARPYVEPNRHYFPAVAPVPPTADNEIVLTDHGDLGSDAVTWESEGYLRDDDRRSYGFGDATALVVGSDVKFVGMPFTLVFDHAPANIFGPLLEGGGSGRDDDFTITNVPFEYAVPVLAGWRLRYPQGDENVQKIGIRLHDVHYDRTGAGQLGTLHYKIDSILRDEGGDEAYSARAAVAVLGFNAHGGVPDLAPKLLRPNPPEVQCRRDQTNRLIVGIRNVGPGPAGASITKVDFHPGGAVMVATPPIPPGLSVDLEPITIPARCFSPNICGFVVTANAGTPPITEVTTANNQGVGTCLIP